MAPPRSPVVNLDTITANSAIISWVGLNNPDIINYTVNLVATSSDAGSNEMTTEELSQCVMRNGGAAESNITVGPDQTLLQVNNLGELGVCDIYYCM